MDRKSTVPPRKWTMKGLEAFIKHFNYARRIEDSRMQIKLIEDAADNGLTIGPGIDRRRDILSNMKKMIFLNRNSPTENNISQDALMMRLNRGQLEAKIAIDMENSLMLREKVTTYLDMRTATYADSIYINSGQIVKQHNTKIVELQLEIIKLTEKAEIEIEQKFNTLFESIRDKKHDMLVEENSLLQGRFKTGRNNHIEIYKSLNLLKSQKSKIQRNFNLKSRKFKIFKSMNRST